QQAQPLADYFFQQLCQEADPRSMEGKAHLATLAAPLIDKVPGANLRTLMRQRLSEITGLNSNNSDPTSHNPVPPAPIDYPPAIHYDAPPDYGDMADIADYADYIEAPAASGYGQQNSWKKTESKTWNKDKNWKKGGNDDAPRGPRKAVNVESPTLTALRTLLHHPQLAQKVEDASHFAAEDDTYAQLLVALLEALQKNPKLRSLQLIARWHGTDQGRLLRALAEKEWLISADNLEQQFFDTITSLAARQREHSLERLLRKAREGELSTEDKEQLRDLLSRNTPVIAPTTTGA
ncbi:MAG: DNA primase, partial [Pseudomonas sp.]|nr:DNA primase [Pseudomonas sp.]